MMLRRAVKERKLDARQVQRQLDVIRVTMGAESSRLAPVAMDAMRLRAFRILDDLETQVNGDLQLLDEIAAVREEIG